MTSLKCEKGKYITGGIIFLLLAGVCGIMFSYSLIDKFCMHLCFFFIPSGCIFLLISLWFLSTGCTMTEDDLQTETPMIQLEE